MIFKVLYQDMSNQVPVRERTKSIYLEADSEKDVRKKISERNYNIEYIHPLDEAHLAYEQQSENFTLETV